MAHTERQLSFPAPPPMRMIGPCPAHLLPLLPMQPHLAVPHNPSFWDPLPPSTSQLPTHVQQLPQVIPAHVPAHVPAPEQKQHSPPSAPEQERQVPQSLGAVVGAPPTVSSVKKRTRSTVYSSKRGPGDVRLRTFAAGGTLGIQYHVTVPGSHAHPGSFRVHIDDNKRDGKFWLRWDEEPTDVPQPEAFAALATAMVCALAFARSRRVVMCVRASSRALKCVSPTTSCTKSIPRCAAR